MQAQERCVCEAIVPGLQVHPGRGLGSIVGEGVRRTKAVNMGGLIAGGRGSNHWVVVVGVKFADVSTYRFAHC